jgi:hypothetical protein
MLAFDEDGNQVSAGPSLADAKPERRSSMDIALSGVQRLIDDPDLRMTPEQAAGVMGNLWHESGGFKQMQEIKPVSGRGGFGWAQWTGPRRRQFEEFVKANNLDPASDDANFQFLKQELLTSERPAFETLKRSGSLDQATTNFMGQPGDMSGFERPGVPALGARRRNARQILAAWNGGVTSDASPSDGGMKIFTEADAAEVPFSSQQEAVSAPAEPPAQPPSLLQRGKNLISDAGNAVEDFAYNQVMDPKSVVNNPGQAAKNLGSAALSGVYRGSEGVLGTLQAGAEATNKYLTGPVFNAFGVQDPVQQLAQTYSKARQGQKTIAERLTPQADSDLASGVYSGMQSITQNLMTIPAAVVTGNPLMALAPMGVMSGGQSYGEARDAGKSPERAALYGTTQGIIEVGTETIPMGKLLGSLKANDALWKTFAKQLVPEMLGEQAATFLQDLDKWVELNPDKTAKEFMAERPSAAIQTAVATLVGTGGQVLLGKAADVAAKRWSSENKIESLYNKNPMFMEILKTETDPGLSGIERAKQARDIMARRLAAAATMPAERDQAEDTSISSTGIPGDTNAQDPAGASTAPAEPTGTTQAPIQEGQSQAVDAAQGPQVTDIAPEIRQVSDNEFQIVDTNTGTVISQHPTDVDAFEALDQLNADRETTTATQETTNEGQNQEANAGTSGQEGLLNLPGQAPGSIPMPAGGQVSAGTTENPNANDPTAGTGEIAPGTAAGSALAQGAEGGAGIGTVDGRDRLEGGSADGNVGATTTASTANNPVSEPALERQPEQNTKDYWDTLDEAGKSVWAEELEMPEIKSQNWDQLPLPVRRTIKGVSRPAGNKSLPTQLTAKQESELRGQNAVQKQLGQPLITPEQYLASQGVQSDIAASNTKANDQDVIDEYNTAVDTLNAGGAGDSGGVLLQKIKTATALPRRGFVQRRIAESIAQVFGHRVVYIEHEDGTTELDRDGAIIGSRPDVILLNKNSQDTFSRVVAHELTHGLRRRAPKIYADMVTALREVYSPIGVSMHLGERNYEQELPKKGDTISAYPGLTDPSRNEEEWVSDFVSDVIHKPTALFRVAVAMNKQRPGSGGKFLRAVDGFMSGLIQKLQGAGFNAEAAIAKKDLQRARNAVTEALAQYANAQQTGTEPEFDGPEILESKKRLTEEEKAEKAQERERQKAEKEREKADRRAEKNTLAAKGFDSEPTNKRVIPATLEEINFINAAVDLAKSRQWKTGRDLRVELDRRINRVAKAAGVDLKAKDQSTYDYLVGIAIREAQEALKTNSSAIGWYDGKLTVAMDIMGEIYLELRDDPQARFGFIWALAVTSNGMKVDRNFELADKVYAHLRVHGRMPENIGEGPAKAKIDEGLATYNEYMDKWGYDRLQSFMTTLRPVREIEQLTGKTISGEGKDEMVYGSIILGPKIGNGFFSNLYGHYEQLTMDRWFMRTWNRWTGDLVTIDPAAIKAKRQSLDSLIRMLDAQERRSLQEIIGGKLLLGDLDGTAALIVGASQKPENRDAMNPIGERDPKQFIEIYGEPRSGQARTNMGAEIRKAGNNLVRQLQGLNDAPKGVNQRKFIRAVFNDALTRLQEVHDRLTMADFQALIWYPEKKRLYEAAKVKEDKGEDYEPDEAPDYANAARNLRASKGDFRGTIGPATGFRGGQRKLDAGDDSVGGRVRQDNGAGQADIPASNRRDSGVNAELAPNPDYIKAGAQGAAAKFDGLPYKDKLRVTRKVGDVVLPKVLNKLGITDFRLEYTMGGFEGLVNPSITIHFGESVSYDQQLEAAKIVGLLWKQKAMIAYNENDKQTGVQNQFVKVIPSKKLSVTEEADLFRVINQRYPDAQGVSTRDGSLVFGNFSEGKVAEQTFHDGIDSAISGIESDVEYETTSTTFRSDWIEPDTLEGYLEGTRYGKSDSAGSQAGRDIPRWKRDFDAIQAESDRLFDEAVGPDIPASNRRPNDPGNERAGSSSAAGDRPGYGQTKRGGVRAVGVHYSSAERKELDGSKYGTGATGAEAERVKNAADQRLANRIYFYINAGQGVSPEQGVGGNAHTVLLKNLYDIDADPLSIAENITGANSEERDNNMESAVIDAGFDGYVADFGNQRAAVLIGDHKVPVRFEGQGRPQVEPGERAEPNANKRLARLMGKDWSRKTPQAWGEYVKSINPSLYDRYAASFTGTSEKFWPDEMASRAKKGAAVDIPASNRRIPTATKLRARQTLTELAKFDQLFMSPKSDAKTMQDIANDINPDIEVKASRDGRNWTIIMEDGSPAFVKTDSDDKLYVDASNLESGKSRGSELYSIIGAYAHNNGLVFKGDPDGLSKKAMIRRTEQMLSSALKYGTTRHLEPHELQNIEWIEGDDAGNLDRLIEKSYRNAVEGNREAGYAGVEGLDDIQFNFKTRQFEQISSGKVFTDDDFRNLSAGAKARLGQSTSNPTGGERPSTPGRTTLKRAALLASLLRETGSRVPGERRGSGRDGILAESAGDSGPVGLNELPPALDGILYSNRRNPNPTFYSQLARGFESSKMNSMPGSQWRAWLFSNKAKLGIKDDEIAWTGIEDYLTLNAKEKLTKADIASYLADNGVRVEEVMKGGKMAPPKELQDYVDYYGGDTSTTDGLLEIARETEQDAQRFQRNGMPDQAQARFRIAELANEMAERGEVGAAAPKFASYTIPGGTNYQELLITLPEREPRNLNDIAQDMFGRRFSDLEDDDANAVTRAEREQKKAENYRSSHWNEPNVLAHLRFDERTDADGNKVMFIQELQSDWGQEGKKRGFATKKSGQFTVDRSDPDAVFIRNEAGEQVGGYSVNLAYGQSDEQLIELYQSGLGGTDGTIPQAPFVTDTKSWLSLGLKRAIRFASENGFDKIAFANGQQNADLYDLSKQVAGITWENTEKDNVLLQAKGFDNNYLINETMPSTKVDDYIGKELGDKIRSSIDRGVYSGGFTGEGLKVGGEGMRKFYDQIVPQTANEVLKKLGGQRLSMVSISTAQDLSDTPEDLVVRINETSGGRFRVGVGAGEARRAETFDTREQAQAWADEQVAAAESGRYSSQPGFDITPALQDKALDGMPLFSNRRNVLNQPALATWTTPDDSKLDNYVYLLQDKHIDTKRIVEKLGSRVSDAWDPYLKETLYHGRAAKDVDDFKVNEIKPLLRAMSTRGITIGELETFLHNRHAKEANEQIARINEAYPDGGSGILTQDAQDYLNNLPAGKRTDLEAMAAQIDAITAGTRRLLVDSGLETQDTIDAWEATYADYVPLQRESEDVLNRGMGTGQGFSTKGPASKRRTGSGKAVVDILANVMMQRERAITRAEKNKVGLALYGLAIQNPNPEFWYPVNPDAVKKPASVAQELVNNGMLESDLAGIIQEPTVASVNPRTGLVEYKINPALRNRDNVLAVRIKGKDRFLFFSTENERAVRMAQSLKNLDAPEMHGLLNAFRYITRYVSSINTQYNPIFGVVNLLRDTQGAMLNLSTTPIAGKQTEVAAKIAPAMAGIYGDLRADRKGKPRKGSAWSQLWEEFQSIGGKTGYRDMYATADDRMKALEKELKAIQDGKVKRLTRGLFDWLSDYNETLENAVRLSAYKVGTESGMSKEQAAVMAKELTVNFNRKGQIASQAGALYAFFNAAVQGTARLAETVKGPAGKKIVAGGLIMGVVQAAIMAAAGYDDDEPPEFLRERNFIIPMPNGKYVSIPMPLGFHVLPNTGRVLTEIAINPDGAGKKIAGLLGSFFDAFNPIGSAGWSVQTIAPTFADPLVALSENRDSFGKEIAKKDRSSTSPTPGFTRTKDTASWLSKQLAWGLNRITGGTDYTQGALSPTPDQLDYVFSQATGGVGREVMKIEQAASAWMTGEELPPYKYPLGVGRFVGDVKSQSAESNRFYANLTRLNELESEIKGRAKDGKDVAGFLRSNPLAALVPAGNQMERAVSELRSKKRKLIAQNAPKATIKALDGQIATQMKVLNDRVKEVNR